MLEEKKNTFIKSGFILSIISIIIAFIPIINYLSIITGTLAIIFSILGIFEKGNKSIAITAIILSIFSGITTYCIINYAMDYMLDTISQIASELNLRINSENSYNTQDVLQNEIDVIFGNFEEFTENYEFDQSSFKLPVTLKNKGTKIKSFNITIEAVDENGDRITEDTVYVQNLGISQSYQTNAFYYVSNDEITERLKNATFKVLDAYSY